MSISASIILRVCSISIHTTLSTSIYFSTLTTLYPLAGNPLAVSVPVAALSCSQLTSEP